MNKRYYTDYVRHILRFYTRNINQPIFTNSVDASDWFACKTVLDKYDDFYKKIIISVYSGNETLQDNVYQVSVKFTINQSIIWDLMKQIEREIAIKRNIYNDCLERVQG